MPAVISPYAVDIQSKPALKRPKTAFNSRPTPRGSTWSWCGFSNTAQSAGLKVSETKHEITVDAAIVVANWAKNRPEMPEMKTDGTKTAQSVRAIAMSAAETSSIVLCAASLADMPRAMLRSTFSTTTMASSTTMPTASTRPNSDRLLIEVPSTARIEKEPTSDTGMAITGMSVARQSCRNKYTTPTTRTMAMPIVSITS